jgi:uncharacterized protein YdeI (YjbR/CyaY-like superfamily)
MATEREPGGPVPRRDPRIDAYIAKAQPFARPILQHIRATVMSASPELEETLKWSHPSFTYHGIVCGMAKAPKARATYDDLSPSHQRDYLEWVTEAKTDATRDKRIATTIEWLKAGKHRNWKYERK